MDLQNTATAGTSKQVIVPRKLYKELGLRRGEYLKVERHGRELVLKPKTFINKEREEILASVAQSMADFKAGRSYGPFDTWESLVAFLHKESANIRKERRSKTTT